MGADNKDITNRHEHIAALLLANRASESMDWGEISHLEGKPCSKTIANRFLLCCLLDYQIPSEQAWQNGYRLVKNILGDPDDVWAAITSASEDEWRSRRAEYNLHRFPAAHNRLWVIGRRICRDYDGDARRIWEGKDSRAALETLWGLGAGDQISRMIVGALRDSGLVKGAASDVKGDVYVCRVLGRAATGEPIGPEAAIQLARQLHPDDPWALDAQLWYIGKYNCHAKAPVCAQCYLAPHCIYALGHCAEIVSAVSPVRIPATRPGGTGNRTRATYRLEVNGQPVSMDGVPEGDVIELGRCLRAVLPAGTRVEYRCVQMNPSGEKYPSWPCPMPRNASAPNGAWASIGGSVWLALNARSTDRIA